VSQSDERKWTRRGKSGMGDTGQRQWQHQPCDQLGRPVQMTRLIGYMMLLNFRQSELQLGGQPLGFNGPLLCMRHQTTTLVDLLHTDLAQRPHDDARCPRSCANSTAYRGQKTSQIVFQTRLASWCTAECSTSWTVATVAQAKENDAEANITAQPGETQPVLWP
jgi:hypothetical protein